MEQNNKYTFTIKELYDIRNIVIKMIMCETKHESKLSEIIKNTNS